MLSTKKNNINRYSKSSCNGECRCSRKSNSKSAVLLKNFFLFFCISCFSFIKGTAMSTDMYDTEATYHLWKAIERDNGGNKKELLMDIVTKGSGVYKGKALAALAQMYEIGDDDMGIDSNVTRAIGLHREAAEVYGNPTSQHIMGVAHATGVFGQTEEVDGVEIDEAKAMVYDYFSALGGNPLAQMALGYRHLHGYGVPQSCENALIYYELASNYVIEYYDEHKTLPPNEKFRISDSTALTGSYSSYGKRRMHGETDIQLVQYYEHTADKGDVAAQLALGSIYYHGSGEIIQNMKLAAFYFEKAASNGDMNAIGYIGELYLFGIGVEKDIEKARNYFLAGAEVGNAMSLSGLGYMYMKGLACERNLDLAMKYLNLAVEKGLSNAMYYLGVIYSGEEDAVKEIKKDKNEEKEYPNFKQKTSAQEWAEQKAKEDLAERQKDFDAAKAAKAESDYEDKLSKIEILSRDGIAALQLKKDDEDHKAQSSSPSSRKNLNKALKQFTRAAQGNHLEALHRIGQIYSQGIATVPNCNAAVLAFKGVTERGPWVADLSKAYYNFQNGDYISAVIKYVESAEIGYEVAQNNAAWLLEMEHCGILSELECQMLSFRLYKQASRQGNAEASLKVGDNYYYGRANLTTDYKKAASYYQIASENRQPQAMFNLGYMHLEGIGLGKDYYLAKRYFDSAAETSADAQWPVRLALITLGVNWGWKLLQEAQAEGRLMEVLYENIPWLKKGEKILDNAIPAMDTVLIIILTTAFFYVMYLRKRHHNQLRDQNREMLERQQREAREAENEEVISNDINNTVPARDNDIIENNGNHN